MISASKLSEYSVALLLVTSVVGQGYGALVSEIVGYSGGMLSVLARFLTLLIAILALCSVTIRTPKAGFYMHAFCVFWLIYLTRVLWDTSRPDAILMWPSARYWLFAFGVSLLPALAISAQRSVNFDLLLRLMFYSLLLLLVFSLPFMSSETISEVGLYYDTGRYSLARSNSITTGHLGATLILCSYASRLISRPIFPSYISLMGFVVGGYIVFIAASKGPLIAVVVTLISAELVRKSVRGTIAIIGGLLILIFLLTNDVAFQALISAVGGSDLGLVSRVTNSLPEYDESTFIRVTLLRNFFDTIGDHLLIGYGLEDPVLHVYPHNLVLEALMSGGLIGGISFLFLCYAGLKGAFYLLSKERSVIIALIYIQYLIAGQFSGAIYSSGVFWVALSLVMLSKNIERKNDHNDKLGFRLT